MTTVLLMHFDGANGSTVTTDVANPSRSITFYQGPSAPTTSCFIDTSTAKFGVSSFTGLNPVNNGPPGLVFGTTTDFNFGTADFTIEFWMNITSGSATTGNTIFNPCAYIGAAATGNEPSLYIQNNPPGGLRFSNSATTQNLIGTKVIVPASGWHSVAISRASNVSRLFIDGVLDVSTADNFNYSGYDVSNAFFFQTFTQNYINYDELRVTKGVGLYTANYTPATAPFFYVPTAPTGVILAFNNDQANQLPYRWKSKRFFVPWPTAYQVARVSADSYLNTTLNLFADGVQFASVPITSQYEFRIPSVTCFKYFEFEIVGTDKVTRAQFAEDVQELT